MPILASSVIASGSAAARHTNSYYIALLGQWRVRGSLFRSNTFINSHYASAFLVLATIPRALSANTLPRSV